MACGLLLACLLAACGGGSSGGTPAPIPPAPPDNVLSVIVDAGPSGNEINRLYTSVTICQAGSSSLCQTIDHVLVDTGSSGLRLFASQMLPSLQLPRQTTASGLPVLNCVQFADNTFAWGPVASVDLVLAGKTAPSTPVQLMGDSRYTALGPVCADGVAMNSVAELGANGILGLGLFTEDCGPFCANQVNNGFYFSCTTASCTRAQGISRSTAQQLRNPIPSFANDNNGLVVDLPAASGNSARLSGSLIFGLGTQGNNAVGASRPLTTDASGYISTLLQGQTLATSYLDTGSNGLYFPSRDLPDCPAPYSGYYYCPSTRSNLSATLRGVNAIELTALFAVDNASSLLANATNSVLPSLAGPSGDASSFDWGLPFFYGRKVYLGFEGKTSTLGTGPYFAY